MKHYAFMIQVIDLIKVLEADEEHKEKLIDSIFRIMAEVVAEKEGLTRIYYEEK